MAKETVVIIDYGSGNLRSAAKSFEHVCANENLPFEIIVSGKTEDIANTSRIVLPGQGAFGDCIRNLSTIDGMIETLNEKVIDQGTPFLGICVGMQLMASKGLEHGEHKGLGWIEGEVVPIQPENKSLKIPHMGWNTLHINSTDNEKKPHFVLRSIENSGNSAKDYYFVHSFMFECKDTHHLLAETNYGRKIPAVVGRDNMIGVQFHPEKSQDNGLQLIANFLHWDP